MDEGNLEADAGVGHRGGLRLRVRPGVDDGGEHVQAASGAPTRSRGARPGFEGNSGRVRAPGVQPVPVGGRARDPRVPLRHRRRRAFDGFWVDDVILDGREISDGKTLRRVEVADADQPGRRQGLERPLVVLDETTNEVRIADLTLDGTSTGRCRAPTGRADRDDRGHDRGDRDLPRRQRDRAADRAVHVDRERGGAAGAGRSPESDDNRCEGALGRAPSRRPGGPTVGPCALEPAPISCAAQRANRSHPGGGPAGAHSGERGARPCDFVSCRRAHSSCSWRCLCRPSGPSTWTAAAYRVTRAALPAGWKPAVLSQRAGWPVLRAAADAGGPRARQPRGGRAARRHRVGAPVPGRGDPRRRSRPAAPWSSATPGW